MDLQLFAEERTEEATPRKLRKAREEGRAPRSPDLAAGIGLVAATMALKSLGPSMYNLMAGALTEAFSGLKTDLTLESLQTLAQSSVLLYLKVLLPLALAVLAVGVITGLLQGNFLFSFKPLAPNFGRINPVTGLSRMFSLHMVVDMLKSLFKLAIIGFIAYQTVAGLIPKIPSLVGQSVAIGITLIASTAVSALQSMGFGLLALGIADYGYQYWEFRRSLRMTKQEVKQEFKEQEGNPELKQKQRQRQREMARRRKALKEVPKADVVITNPTHYAIAVQYQANVDAAPRVVAKGVDLLAQRIKVIAKQHNVPTYENRPLARTLYDTVEVGHAIPPELYQAVAEVLAFVYSVRRQDREQDRRD